MSMPAIPFIHAIALMLKRLSGNWISVSQDKGNIHLKIGCVPECNTIKMTVVLAYLVYSMPNGNVATSIPATVETVLQNI